MKKAESSRSRAWPQTKERALTVAPVDSSQLTLTGTALSVCLSICLSLPLSLSVCLSLSLSRSSLTPSLLSLTLSLSLPFSLCLSVSLCLSLRSFPLILFILNLMSSVFCLIYHSTLFQSLSHFFHYSFLLIYLSDCLSVWYICPSVCLCFLMSLFHSSHLFFFYFLYFVPCYLSDFLLLSFIIVPVPIARSLYTASLCFLI